MHITVQRYKKNVKNVLMWCGMTGVLMFFNNKEGRLKSAT